MAALPCCTEGAWKRSAAPRVDWPVYPRRAKHNTVAERGNRVFEPIHYSSVDALIASLDEKITRPAEARFVELLKRKADTMGGEHV